MKKLATLALLAALALFGACGEEHVEERLLLRVTSDPAPSRIDALRVLFSQETETGAVIRYPESVNSDRANRPLGVSEDPSEKAYILNIEYGNLTFPDPSVRLQVLGFSNGTPVAIWVGPLNIAGKGVVPVHMRVLSEACDADGDGFPNCVIQSCCTKSTETWINDCHPESKSAYPWSNPELCDELDNDCNGITDDGITGIGVECSSGVGDCKRVGEMKCLGGTAPTCTVNDGTANSDVCDDGNVCTTDGLCWFGTCDGTAPVANGTPCDDGNACTTEDVCTGEICTGIDTSTTVCDDGKKCTIDSCHPTDGCRHEADPTCGCEADAECDDGNICTDETCQSGTCVYVDVSDSCDDNDACTDDNCDPASGCVNVDVSASCDDGNVCTDDSCSASSGCVNVDNTAACDDNDVCTTGDVCANGACGGAAADCDDNLKCTDDSCDPTSGCVHTPIAGCSCETNADCNDNNLCTEDSCQSGACVNVDVSASCDDNDACTEDSCSPTSGCVNVDNSASCDDGNVCTDDSCNASSGCVYVNNTATCDDNDACTNGDQCSNGSCAGGSPLVCDDGNVCTDDSCSPASGCVYVNNTATCDDNDACTVGDICANGACGGATADCNDGLVCTTDSCSPASGCINAPNDGSCDDGNVCTDDSCDPASGCINANNTATCDDGDACTTGDQCSGGSCMGGSPLVCDDGNACTEDSCDTSSGCVSIDVVTATCDDGNPCTLDGCDSASGACVHTLVIPCTLVIPAGDYAADAGGGNLVSVAEFAIMATEVTLAEYVDCLLDIKCSEPSVGSGCNYGTSGRSEHPANCVTATQAVEYCASIGGSLPTEDQWKKAARGDLDSRIYPWGDTAPDCAVAIYNNGASGCGGSSTSPVGSLPAGMSPYGVQDMAGNVWEWVIPNDPCPTGQSFICGGGWNSPPGDLDIDGCKCTTLTQSSVIGVGHCVVPVP